MVEAQAAGTPVIAYGRGGARDIVQPLGGVNPATGVFFDRQDEGALIEAVHAFESNQAPWSSAACTANANRFNENRFVEQFKAYVLSRWEAAAG